MGSKTTMIDMPPAQGALLSPGDRFDRLDGMDFPGVVASRFIDKTGRICYVVRIRGRFGMAIVRTDRVASQWTENQTSQSPD